MSENKATQGVKVQTKVKAGLFDVFRRPPSNHNETLAASRPGVKMATGVRAGRIRIHQ
jgi:hypothetical protein